MPKVPFSGNVVPIQGGQGPSQTDFWMAAAMMHQEGRLIDPAQEERNNYRGSISRGWDERSRQMMKEKPDLKEPELDIDEGVQIPGRGIG